MNKLLSCRYNMDTNRVEARFADGSTIAIDCIAVEDEYGNTPAQRAELDWLLYNKPLEYAQLVLGGEVEHYLSLGCDHGWKIELSGDLTQTVPAYRWSQISTVSGHCLHFRSIHVNLFGLLFSLNPRFGSTTG